MSDAEQSWKRCSACKEPIGFGATYWTCSVSTCNRKRTALYFCTVSCWEVHLPVARHREAWAEENQAPTRQRAEAAARAESQSQSQQRAPRKKIVREAVPARPAATESRPTATQAASAGNTEDVPHEILIIASRLKDYIRARSGHNTSERVLGPLSDIVREVCDRAIANADRDDRQTVLDRDVPRPPRS